MDISGHNQKVECIVNYEYLASEPDELTLRVGDTVHEVERLPGGWWRGELHGKRGMFPDNFVTVIKGDDGDLPVLRKNGPSGRCRAVFSYQCANPDELSLSAGDTLEVLGEVEEGWWQGRTRSGKLGVFPSNFVVLLDPPPPAHRPVSQADAPSLPPKPVKEQCRVLFPYTAINEDELTLAEGDIVTLVSRDGPDRGWWRGELRGRVGLFPDNFVAPIPSTIADYGEKKPDRPPAIKGTVPVSSKHSEKTSSVKESTLSKTSRVKDDTLSKSMSIVKENSVITHKESVKQTEVSERTSLNASNLNEPHSQDSLPKKPPVPLKKSTTPTSTVAGLFGGFKNKMLSSEKDKDWAKDKDKEKEPPANSAPTADRLDGTSVSRLSVSPGPTLPSTPSPASPSASDGFDRVERNSILNDLRAARVKAPRRRPPSQPSRDEPSADGLSNGVEHEGDKTEQMKPKARGWEKQKAPWMEELKLNQAKKTSTISDIGKTKSVSASSHSESSHTQYSLQSKTGSTDQIVECGTEERKRESTHSMEMSKSMSSITNKVTKLETFEELQLRVREPSAEPPAQERRVSQPAAPLTNSMGVNHPTNTIQPPSLPSPTRSPTAAGRTIHAPSEDVIRTVTPTQLLTNEQTLIAQLNSRIANLEKLVEAQNAKFSSAIEELTTKLLLETEKRMALQSEVEKLAQCVTQV